jgi:hypothetical protein
MLWNAMRKQTKVYYTPWIIADLSPGKSDGIRIHKLMLRNGLVSAIEQIYSFTKEPISHRVIVSDEGRQYIEVVDSSSKKTYWYIEEGEVSAETLIWVAQLIRLIS